MNQRIAKKIAGGRHCHHFYWATSMHSLKDSSIRIFKNGTACNRYTKEQHARAARIMAFRWPYVVVVTTYEGPKTYGESNHSRFLAILRESALLGFPCAITHRWKRTP